MQERSKLNANSDFCSTLAKFIFGLKHGLYKETQWRNMRINVLSPECIKYLNMNISLFNKYIVCNFGEHNLAAKAKSRKYIHVYIHRRLNRVNACYD